MISWRTTRPADPPLRPPDRFALTNRFAQPAGGFLFFAALCLAGTPAQAQEPAVLRDGSTLPAPASEADAEIEQRLERIFAQIDSLSQLEVSVVEGVVTIEGTTLDQTSAREAEDIARSLEGVVAVQDNTAASVDVTERTSPFFIRLKALTRAFLNSAPLFLLSLLVVAVISALGWWWAASRGFWRRVSPNPFIADLLAQAVRVVAVILGVVIALNLVGANALLGTVLGGAGVLGLAIGFAVRDSLENYISSIMLSLRQPFRANDHVLIDGHEGKVVRLTSRATVLMTLDGNHLRIPNAAVFKAVILNYTRNPERRFQFDLGVDAADDPQAAIETGLTALRALGFVLDEPAPAGIVDSVGDSNIVLRFFGWVDQSHTDFGRARSLAIRTTKVAIEAAGFTLPEPIYRLRIDQPPPRGPGGARATPPPVPAHDPAGAGASVAREDYLDDKIAAERRGSDDEDLLNAARPIE
jgi:small conductance mechanosensitive channel